MWSTCVAASQWNYYDHFVGSKTLCSDKVCDPKNATFCENYYELIGKYGWCPDGVNTAAHQPQSVSAIQALNTANCVFLFLGGLLALLAPSLGKKTIISATAFALTASALSAATFAVAASFDWYKSFKSEEKGHLPFMDDKGNVFVSTGLVMYWGPAFWSVVFVFIIAFLCTVCLCSITKNYDSGEDDDDQYGSYGSGEYGRPQDDPVYDYGKMDKS
jgi:hypothetical protein